MRSLSVVPSLAALAAEAAADEAADIGVFGGNGAAMEANRQ